MGDEAINEIALAKAFRTVLSEVIRDQLHVFGIFIDGVEVTQAIQYRRAQDHLTDAADRGPDNSIRLVADKPAYVRVYVQSNLATVNKVTAQVTIQRRRYGVWFDTVTLAPEFPGIISAENSPPYAIERGSLRNSLNFILSAGMMRGQLRLKVHAEVSGSTQYQADTIVDLDVSLLQTLRMRGIPVRYWGPDAAGNPVQLAAPTLADFQTAASLTLRMWPVARTPDIGLAGIFTQSAPLTGAITVDPKTNQSQCPQSWNNLLFWLNIAKVVDGNRADRLYYALLPAAIPVGGAGGCGGGGGVGAGPIGPSAGQAMAHELGHVMGFGHAPCGLVTGDMGDTNYPAYEPYDSVNNKRASIGEYGLDTSDGSIYSPSNSRDFMSYCANWISLYHYQALIQAPLLDPAWVSDPYSRRSPSVQDALLDPVPHHIPDPIPPWVGRRVIQLAEPDPVAMIVLTGHIRDGQVDIRSVLRLKTGPTLVGERLHGIAVELLDAQGQVLGRAPLRRMMAQACGCGCAGELGDEETSGVVQALLPDPGEGVTLRVVRDGEAVWSRQAPSEPPTVNELNAVVEGDDLHVRWTASAAADANALERFVRWSGDDGQTWQMLTLDLSQDEAVVPVNGLTSGRALVQVLVSDGFYSTVSEPAAVDVPPRPPQVAILWPPEGSTVSTSASLHLWGVVTASDGKTLDGDVLRWDIDGEPVGSGSEVWAHLPEWEGEHRATLSVTDNCGCQISKASVVFLATTSGQQPYRLPR
jgi:hypothetical protein